MQVFIIGNLDVLHFPIDKRIPIISKFTAMKIKCELDEKFNDWQLRSLTLIYMCHVFKVVYARQNLTGELMINDFIYFIRLAGERDNLTHTLQKIQMENVESLENIKSLETQWVIYEFIRMCIFKPMFEFWEYWEASWYFKRENSSTSLQKIRN